MRTVKSLVGAGLICTLAGCLPNGIGGTGTGNSRSSTPGSGRTIVLDIFNPPSTQTSEEDIANFEAAVASVGCNLITIADYQPVEIQTGMTHEQVLEIAQSEIDAGKAAPIEGGGVQLQTGACSPQNA